MNSKIIKIIFIVVFLVISLSFVRPIFIESYCQNQAEKTIGGKENWSSQYFPVNDYEAGYLTRDGQIAWGFREQLRCERNFK